MLFVTLCALAIVMQLPRDARPAGEAPAPPRGTGVIRGQVTALDSGQPLRRAVVMLSGGPTPPRGRVDARTDPWARVGPPAGFINRSIATNAEGLFQFTGLPAGTYRLRVMPGQHRAHYLSMAFGARNALDVGKPIELGDGQTFEAKFALPRGGAISGRVVDDFGEPVSRVMVAAARAASGDSFQRVGMGDQTDDQGRFRIYGLEPGEYIVSADVRNEGGPEVEGPAEGFALTYFPSAFNEREAGRVRVALGQGASDVDIVLVRTRTFRISGSIVDSHGNTRTSGNVMLMRAGTTPSGSGFYSGSVMFDASGRFTIRNVVPGNYRLVVRPDGGPHPDEQTAGKGLREWASVSLSVDGNVDDLVVVTQPGATVSGQIVFADGPPRTETTNSIRVNTEAADRMLPIAGSPPVEVDAAFRFTLRDLFGSCYIRAFGFPRGYIMKAVMLGGTDITDRPTEFRKEHNGHLQIVLTSRSSALEGTVTDDRGEPASEVSVLLLPEDKTSWRFGNSRMRITTASDGKFRMEGLLAGRYHAVAIPRDVMRPSRDLGPEVFEPFLKDATAVVLNEDETRTIDLRVARE